MLDRNDIVDLWDLVPNVAGHDATLPSEVVLKRRTGSAAAGDTLTTIGAVSARSRPVNEDDLGGIDVQAVGKLQVWSVWDDDRVGFTKPHKGWVLTDPNLSESWAILTVKETVMKRLFVCVCEKFKT